MMYWYKILRAVLGLRKELRSKAHKADKMMDMQSHIHDTIYYMGMRDAYRDAAARTKDVYDTYRVI